MSDPTQSIDVRALAGRKGQWMLTLEADAVTLAAKEGGETHQIPREEAPERLELVEPLIGGALLRVRLPKVAVFALQAERTADDAASAANAERVKQWIGPLTDRHLKVALKRRFPWIVPIGILFLVTSVPLPGDPEQGIEALPFDPYSAGLGAMLLGIALLQRVIPRKELFVLDATWFVLAAVKVTADVLSGASWLWWILVAIMVSAAVSGVREFRRFS